MDNEQFEEFMLAFNDELETLNNNLRVLVNNQLETLNETFKVIASELKKLNHNLISK